MRTPDETVTNPGLDSGTGALLMQALADADTIERRLELFVWMQRLGRVMLPHQLLVYGVARPNSARLAYEVYYEQPLDPQAVARLIDGADGVVLRLFDQWLEAGCRPVHLVPDAHAAGPERELHELGFGHTLVHGVARAPQAGGAFGLFVFVSLEAAPGPRELRFVRLVVPQLFASYCRTIALEHHPSPGGAEPGGDWDTAARITEREAEVLRWVRDGKSNHEIGIILSISALTVKNHVQKILRKLGATNRAQAVSKAIALKMLPTSMPRRPAGSGGARGFTLLEVLVVLVIIGLLVGIVAPRFFSQVGKSESRVARAQIDALAKALDQYRIDTGRYPSPEQGLAALVKAPEGEARWGGPYLTQAVPNDPWGRPYSYRSNAEGSELELGTQGKDGRPGGQGDGEDIVLRR